MVVVVVFYQAILVTSFYLTPMVVVSYLLHLYSKKTSVLVEAAGTLQSLLTPVLKLCTMIVILSPAFLMVCTANSCDEFLTSVPSTTADIRCVYKGFENFILQTQFSPKILSPTLSSPSFSAELPGIMLFIKIPDISPRFSSPYESPDTLTLPPTMLIPKDLFWTRSSTTSLSWPHEVSSVVNGNFKRTCSTRVRN